jgi:hypothetical protein
MLKTALKQVKKKFTIQTGSEGIIFKFAPANQIALKFYIYEIIWHFIGWRRFKKIISSETS